MILLVWLFHATILPSCHILCIYFNGSKITTCPTNNQVNDKRKMLILSKEMILESGKLFKENWQSWSLDTCAASLTQYMECFTLIRKSKFPACQSAFDNSVVSEKARSRTLISSRDPTSPKRDLKECDRTGVLNFSRKDTFCVYKSRPDFIFC